MRLGLTSLLSLLTLVSPFAAFAGAWQQQPGHGLAILSGYYYGTDHYFDRHGNSQPQPDFTKYELNPYVEYGVNEDWTVGASLFLDSLSQDGAAGAGDQHNLGLGNSTLFGRYHLWQQGRFSAALEPFVGLPATYRHDREPQSGHMNFDAGLFASLGYSADWVGPKDFIEGSAGYRHRFGVLDDQWVLSAKVGLNVLPQLTIIPEVQFTLPNGGLGNNSRRSVAGDNDYRLARLQLSAVYDVNDAWSVQAGVFDHADGENTGEGGGGLLSVWRRF